eukprot:COSAG01_NODE_1677_length_9518_cov_11.599321_13_plen_100_part_00
MLLHKNQSGVYPNHLLCLRARQALQLGRRDFPCCLEINLQGKMVLNLKTLWSEIIWLTDSSRMMNASVAQARVLQGHPLDVQLQQLMQLQPPMKSPSRI